MNARLESYREAQDQTDSALPLRLSPGVYFAWVGLLTASAFVAALFFNPVLARSIGEVLGLIERPQPAIGSFYAVRVSPLFEAHCIGCHGVKRQKASLRLDSYAAVIRGGKHGTVVKAGSPQDSELFSRITLPSSDEKAMPPEGKSSLTADDVKVIELWIAAGASGVLPVDEIKGAPKPVVQIKFPTVDESAVQLEREPLAALVRSLGVQFPGVVSYESRASADVEVNASLLGDSFDDADLAALAPLHERVVRLDLSGTSISDAAASTLVSMKRLRVLRLVNTDVTDKTVEALASMPALQSLAVGRAATTQQSLAPLRSKGVRIYVGEEMQDINDGE